MKPFEFYRNFLNKNDIETIINLLKYVKDKDPSNEYADVLFNKYKLSSFIVYMAVRIDNIFSITFLMIINSNGYKCKINY